MTPEKGSFLILGCYMNKITIQCLKHKNKLFLAFIRVFESKNINRLYIRIV